MGALTTTLLSTTTILLCLLMFAEAQPFEEEDTNKANPRTLCCADARQQCGDWCGTRPCEETCTFYCGPFNTNCGTWTCEDVAGFSCTRTTTTTTTVAAGTTATPNCAATG